MFLDLTGTLHDYFNGYEDLELRRIRFVGDASERIQEDYLRIFRYFRFHTRYGEGKIHEKESLQAIRDNVEGISKVSGERIWMEMKRILPLRRCADAIHIMFHDINIGNFIGLSKINADKGDLNEFHMIHRNLHPEEKLNDIDYSYDPITLFTALVKDEKELLSISLRLKISKLERETAMYILVNRTDCHEEELKFFKSQLAVAPKSDEKTLRYHIIEFLKYCGRWSEVSAIIDFEIPKFPVNGLNVAQKVKDRRNVGKFLEELKWIWANNNFVHSEDELLSELDSIIQRNQEKTQN